MQRNWISRFLIQEPFFESHPWPLIIDDVQKAVGLLSEIKKLVYEQRKIWLKNNESRRLMFVLTVSNQFELQEGISESLAGRNAVGINVETCKRWISILQTSGIIYLLEPYMSNVSKRIIKAPELYFMDTGLCAYLCKWPNSQVLWAAPFLKLMLSASS